MKYWVSAVEVTCSRHFTVSWGHAGDGLAGKDGHVMARGQGKPHGKGRAGSGF